jgi:hypothetical protein
VLVYRLLGIGPGERKLSLLQVPDRSLIPEATVPPERSFERRVELFGVLRPAEPSDVVRGDGCSAPRGRGALRSRRMLRAAPTWSRVTSLRSTEPAYSGLSGQREAIQQEHSGLLGVPACHVNHEAAGAPPLPHPLRPPLPRHQPAGARDHRARAGLRRLPGLGRTSGPPGGGVQPLKRVVVPLRGTVTSRSPSLFVSSVSAAFARLDMLSLPTN